MSTPSAPADLVPNVPTSLTSHKNPALRLTATMLQLGFDELRTLYTTVSKYNAVKKDSEELLKDSDNEVVQRYRDALDEQAEKDAADKAEYEATIKPIRDALNAKLNTRASKVHDDFYVPALSALNLDAGINEDDYTSASADGKQLATTLQSTLQTLTKQAETSATSEELSQLKSITIPKISGSISASDAPAFTPKFAQVKINDTIVDPTKIKAAEIAKRVGVTRDQFIVQMGVPWAGDTDIWTKADPGFSHTFEAGKGDTKYKVEVIKAARNKANTEIPADTTDNSDAPVTGENEAPVTEDAPVQF